MSTDPSTDDPRSTLRARDRDIARALDLCNAKLSSLGTWQRRERQRKALCIDCGAPIEAGHARCLDGLAPRQVPVPAASPREPLIIAALEMELESRPEAMGRDAGRYEVIGSEWSSRLKWLASTEPQ